MFEKLKLSIAAKRLHEETLYKQVVEELSQGQRRDGLWAKAMADSEGIEDRAKSLYIRYRVQSIQDESELAKASVKRQELHQEQASTTEAELNNMLLQSALHGRIPEVQSALDKGANINARNPHGATALFLAVLHGRVELVQVLVSAGADKKIPNNSGKAPLEVAIEAQYEKIIGIL